MRIGTRLRIRIMKHVLINSRYSLAEWTRIKRVARDRCVAFRKDTTRCWTSSLHRYLLVYRVFPVYMHGRGGNNTTKIDRPKINQENMQPEEAWPDMITRFVSCVYCSRYAIGIMIIILIFFIQLNLLAYLQLLSIGSLLSIKWKYAPHTRMIKNITTRLLFLLYILTCLLPNVQTRSLPTDSHG